MQSYKFTFSNMRLIDSQISFECSDETILERSAIILLWINFHHAGWSSEPKSRTKIDVTQSLIISLSINYFFLIKKKEIPGQLLKSNEKHEILVGSIGINSSIFVYTFRTKTNNQIVSTKCFFRLNFHALISFIEIFLFYIMKITLYKQNTRTLNKNKIA